MNGPFKGRLDLGTDRWLLVNISLPEGGRQGGRLVKGGQGRLGDVLLGLCVLGPLLWQFCPHFWRLQAFHGKRSQFWNNEKNEEGQDESWLMPPLMWLRQNDTTGSLQKLDGRLVPCRSQQQPRLSRLAIAKCDWRAPGQAGTLMWPEFGRGHGVTPKTTCTTTTTMTSPRRYGRF